MDPRHLKRLKIVQNLFAESVCHQKTFPFEEEKIETQKILTDKDKIDSSIKKHIQKFTIDRMAKIDLAILRLACYELLKAKEPKKAVVNEAVDLAKELGGDKSFALVNGILGKLLT